MSNKGTLDKNSSYRRHLYDRVEKKFKNTHPIFQGIKMQAHHIISADGVKDIVGKNFLINADYDIDHVKNLAFIPCAFEGACHLGTQLHRGNHTSTIDLYKDIEDDYSDDDHPDSYHVTVGRLVSRILKNATKDCIDKKNEVVDLLGEMEDIADEIIQLINRFSSDAQLTKAYQTFDTEGELKSIGCSNATKMDDHNTKQPCRSHRDHAGNVIKRPKSRSAYKLELGK